MVIVPAFETIGDIIAVRQPQEPLLCFEADRVRQRVAEFQAGFPGQVTWAVKANSDPMVIQAVCDAGIQAFDVASIHEIETMRRLSPNAFLNYNNPIRSPSSIEGAYFDFHVRSFSVDDAQEIEKIIRVLTARGVDDFSDVTISVRFIEPSVKGSDHYDFASKFGAAPQKASALLAQAKAAGFKLGLCFHPGSLAGLPSVYGVWAKTAESIVEATPGVSFDDITMLNVGGGFSCYYAGKALSPLSEYFAAIKEGASAFKGKLICEPGRALVADSVHCLARVNMVKDNGGLYINDGLYGSFLEFCLMGMMPMIRVYAPDGRLIDPDGCALRDYTIWGATCDSLDKFPTTLSLPAEITDGYYIVAAFMGAYTNASASRFNGFSPAEMVAVKKLDNWDRL